MWGEKFSGSLNSWKEWKCDYLFINLFSYTTYICKHFVKIYQSNLIFTLFRFFHSVFTFAWLGLEKDHDLGDKTPPFTIVTTDQCQVVRARSLLLLQTECVIVYTWRLSIFVLTFTALQSYQQISPVTTHFHWYITVSLFQSASSCNQVLQAPSFFFFLSCIFVLTIKQHLLKKKKKNFQFFSFKKNLEAHETLKADSTTIRDPHEVFYTGNPTFDGVSAPYYETVGLHSMPVGLCHL